MRYARSKFHFNFFVFSYAVRGATRASILYTHFAKIAIKCKCATSIASIFGTNEEHVTADSCTKFAVDLRNIQGVMSIIQVKKIKLLSWLQGKPSIGIT